MSKPIIMRKEDFVILETGEKVTDFYARAKAAEAAVGGIHPVIAVFDEMQEIVESKAHDYAKDTNVFSNFEFAADVANVTVTQEFMVMIGTKVARLREIGSGKAPNNESFEDSLLDLANYAALCVAYMREKA